MEFNQLERRRATDEVYAIIRRGILDHHFQPGDRLNIDDIAKRLGVSLTPVRHAVQQLAAEGLIEIRPRSGTFVATLSPMDIAETFDIRRALECLAAETAVANLTAENLGRLRQLATAAATPSDRVQHDTANFEFHRILMDASGNRRLQEMYEELKAHLQIGRIHGASGNDDWHHRLACEHAEHQEIIDAAEVRDKARMVAAVHHHIDRAKHALIGSLQSYVPTNA